MPDEVTAYTAIEELLYARNCLRRCELRVDCDVSVFVLEECEFVGLWELRNQVED